jgi:hypothetical protein
MPYGKWINSAVDPSLTPDATNGTAPAVTAIQGIGSMMQQTVVIGKGQPHVCDMIRTGRAESRMNGGDLANGYATFAGFAAQNDTTTNRWGLIQSVSGGYQWKGLMVLGHASAVDFRDSNVNIFIQDCRKVSSTFNKIEIRQAGSRVDWTGVSIANVSPSTNASKGDLAVIDDADVNFESCTFTDMGTFVFLTGAVVNNTIFRRCGQVTVGGSTFTGCTFDDSTAASAVLASSPANAALVSGATFTSDGTGHAIEITGTAASFTLTDVTFSGYAGTDGSTGNEAVYVNIASGSLNLTVDGGTTPSIRTAGCVVTVISGAVTATVTVTDAAGTAIQDARVFLRASNGTGPFPFDATVTISNSGTTATVTHAAHGMANNDKVVISGASLNANNGVFSITVTGTGTYTYTMASTPGSSPTGTIKSTYVAIEGTTNVSGQISMSRVFPSDQPVTGWARKSSAAPYFKTGPIVGTIDSGTGATLSAVLIADE